MSTPQQLPPSSHEGGFTEVSNAAPAANQVEASSALDYNLDYNNALRTIIASTLAAVPEVGGLLGALVNILWPSSASDVWAQIEARVEALVNEKIAQNVKELVANNLQGLYNVTTDLLATLQHSKDDTAVISEKWNSAQEQFLHDLPQFQWERYRLELLPLFAQFANLHLTLLRDGVKFGAEWGWSPSYQAQVRQQLTDTIAAYSDYVGQVYAARLVALEVFTKPNKFHTEPFNTVNRFLREMTLTVLDFQKMWPYYDVSKYPDPVQVTLDREIFSDVFGTADDTGLSMPGTSPTQPISSITVWGWDRIDAVQVDYPSGGGPDGQTSTGRMGGHKGGSGQPPFSGTFDTSSHGPIVSVKMRSSDCLNAMWFTFEDGTTSYQLGGNYPQGVDYTWSFSDEILSSIKVMGVSRFYGSANAAVLGFKFKDQGRTTPSDMALRAAFVAAPEEVRLEALADRFGLSDAARTQMAQLAARQGWEALRREWHAVLRSRTARAST